MTSTGDSGACPPQFVVAKQARGEKAVHHKLNDGSDVYVGGYTVTVYNPSQVAGNTGQIVDYPVVPAGFDIVGVTVDGQEAATATLAEGNTHIPSVSGSVGPYLVSEGVDLAPGLAREFTVEVYYKPTASITEENWTNAGVCTDASGGNPSGTGLPNVVSLNGEPTTEWDNNDACVTVERPKDEAVSLNIKKMDYKNPDTALTGAEFKIYPVVDGYKKGETAEKTLDKPETDGSYKATDLKPDTFYYLVETKSPVGYELLAEPVLFKIVKDTADQTKHTVEFYNPPAEGQTVPEKQLAPALVSSANPENPEAATAYMVVADVQTGDLPLTGGRGLGLTTGLALFFIMAGFFEAKRRKPVLV